MGSTDPQNLIHHIDSAKTWLDKAKEEFIESNEVGAGMHLNLAQAEVKYAWELSRRQDVSQIDRKFRNEQRHYWLPAAAVLVLFALGSVLSLQLARIPENGRVNIAKQPVHTLTKEKSTVVQPTQATPVNQKTGIGLAAEKVSPGTDGKKNPTVAVVPAMNKPSAERTEVLPKVSGSVPVKLENETVKSVASNTVQSIRSSENTGTVKPQPVSGINIDEEALTREASNSLRLGK